MLAGINEDLDIASNSRNKAIRPQINNREKPSLLVNASRIGSKGGLYTFALTLLQCLANLQYEVEAVLPEGITVTSQLQMLRTPAWLGSSSRVSRLRPILWLFYSSFFFPARRGRRILSTTHHVLPFRRRQIVTVHDLRPLYEPDSWVQYFYFRYLLPISLRSCDGILTVSQTSKHELIRVYGISDERIYVVPNAIAAPSQELNPVENVPEDHIPFLLMVGASWKHKNAIELLDHHAMWEGQYQLKIVAGKGQYLEMMKQRVLELHIEDKVDFIEEIDNKNLETLYSNCSALVYPSRIEGFGLPPLDAMAHGRPVILSDIPVFRELFEEAPLYVQLGNPESWLAAFNQLDEVKANQSHWRRSAGQRIAGSYSIDRMQTALQFALREIWDI